MKIVTYADVLVILMAGVFLFVINVIKKGVGKGARIGCRMRTKYKFNQTGAGTIFKVKDTRI